MKKRILFIINPISGNKRGTHIKDKIEKMVDRHHYDFSVVMTEYKGHASELAARAVKEEVDVVVAAGGDGTINEVASSLVDSKTTLGILPIGSGNGLARHLSIPLRTDRALELLNAKFESFDTIDVGRANDIYFFSIAGIGYDAKVAYDFNRGKDRGFHGYFKQIVKNYFEYDSDTYRISYDNKQIDRKAFFITFANSSQWGYNVRIKPTASVKDGWLDVLICKKPNFFILSYVVLELFVNRIDQSKIMESFRGRNITVSSKNGRPLYLHIDGDSVEPVGTVNVDLLSAKLKVISGI